MMAIQQMTIIISAMINTDTWNFDQASKETRLKGDLRMRTSEFLSDLDEDKNIDVGVDLIEIEYGDQL
jgi:hypothetical protein